MTTAKRPRKSAAKKPMGGPRTHGKLQEILDDCARRAIEDALREAGGNVVQAARALGISHPAMYKRMAVLGIDPMRHR